MRRVAALPATRADPALQQLSRAANHSALWLGVAAVLAVRKGATRRAGLRGVAAIAGASFTGNAVGKRVFPRRRLNGEPRQVWMIFVGNGTYAPKGFAPSRRPALDVRLRDGNRRLATDGEIGPLGSRFVFRSRPGTLTVYR